MIIDSHHHLWKYVPEQYGWINHNLSAIARDFSVEELRSTATSVGVTGSIVVQARQSIEETRWLVDLARKNEFVLGVVGWAPLASPEVGRTLDELAERNHLKGYRHVVQDEPDDSFILGESFNRGVDLVIERDLTYDILIFERHLPQAIQFVDRHPNGRFVLDHIAKPRIATGDIEPWRAHIRKLARRANVVCKLSGVVTEAGPAKQSLHLLRPYLDTVLEAFGPQRLMFGSDWPVCLLACEYARWLAIILEWSAEFSETERDFILCKTAIATYQLATSTM